MKNNKTGIKFLSKYILIEFLKPFFYSIMSFVLIFIIVEILQRIKTFHDNHALLSDIVSYYIYKTPFIIIQMLPLASILAVLFSTGNLIKNNEIIALKSSGIHSGKIFYPIILFAFLLGIGVFSVNELIIPNSNYIADKINEERIRKMSSEANEVKYTMAYWGGKGELLFTERFFVTSGIMEKIKLFTFNDKKELMQIISTDKAYWKKNEWKMDSGYVRTFKNDSIINEKQEKNIILPFSSSLKDLSIGQRSPEKFSFWELRGYIKKIKESGQQYEYNYLVDLYIKTSVPFYSLVIVILGIPIALGSPKGSISIELGIGILISFIFWGSNQMFYSLGKNNILSPLFSAWIGNIIFLIIGCYTFYKQR